MIEVLSVAVPVLVFLFLLSGWIFLKSTTRLSGLLDERRVALDKWSAALDQRGAALDRLTAAVNERIVATDRYAAALREAYPAVSAPKKEVAQ